MAAMVDALKNWFSPEPPKPGKVYKFPGRRAQKRSYAAASVDRLTEAFRGTTGTADSELISSLRKMRARSRQLSQDNDYAKRFLSMVRTNVIGPSGIRLQSMARRDDGSFDKQDQAAVEAAFKSWGNRRICTPSGRLSWHDVQNLVVTSLARDGEMLLRHVRGANNAFGYAVHPVEADYLDEEHNQTLPNGNRIIMGVEVDSWQRPVNYYLRTSHPGDQMHQWAGKAYERVPANQIEHLFLVERWPQNRGVPWMQTAIRRLNMLAGYEEAELVAAREASNKMGFYTTPDGSADLLATDAGTDEEAPLQQSEAGTFETLPQGVSFTPFDPQHPVSAFESFVKEILRGAASGLCVSYHTLSGDLEGVNFSSIRSGVLEERDVWRMLHSWVADHLHQPVFDAWLPSALATQALRLPPRRIEKYRAIDWRPRGWAWVDPLKDGKANSEMIDMHVKTRAEIAAERGVQLEDVIEQLARENELIKAAGLAPAEPTGAIPNE